MHIQGASEVQLSYSKVLKGALDVPYKYRRSVLEVTYNH